MGKGKKERARAKKARKADIMRIANSTGFPAATARDRQALSLIYDVDGKTGPAFEPTTTEMLPNDALWKILLIMAARWIVLRFADTDESEQDKCINCLAAEIAVAAAEWGRIPQWSEMLTRSKIQALGKDRVPVDMDLTSPKWSTIVFDTMKILSLSLKGHFSVMSGMSIAEAEQQFATDWENTFQK